MASKPEGWKAFGHDTEAGRLLQKIYGKHSRPKINYPTPKQMVKQERRPFCPAGGQLESDARRATRREVNIFVPVPKSTQTRRKPPALIDCHSGRKKHVKDISADLDSIRKHMHSFRPARAPEVSTDANKRILQTRFQFKGGKALPEFALLAPIDDLSPEEYARLKGAKTSKSKPQTEQELFDQILKEINDYRSLLAELEKRNDFSRHASVKADMQRKINDLETLDKLMNT